MKLASACPHAFRVGRLGPIGRWSRSIGYTIPIESRDTRFDETWSVETDDREFGEALARDAEARRCVGRLGQLRCTSVVHDRRRLHARLIRAGWARDKRAAQKDAILKELVVLDGVIARVCRGREFPHHPSRQRPLIAVLAALLTANAVGFVMFMRCIPQVGGPDFGGLMLRSLLFSIPAAVLVIVIMAKLLAGHSSSHRQLRAVVAFTLYSCPLLGGGVALFLNRALDPGPESVWREPVLRLEQAANKSAADDRAIVGYWHDEKHKTCRVPVTRSQYEALEPGKSWLKITTSPGRFEVERITNVEIEPPAPDH